MPLRIDQVDTEIELTDARTVETKPAANTNVIEDRQYRESLRQLILEIIEGELERLRREGR